MSGYHSVLRIKEKSFSCGFGKDKSKGNTVVAQKRMELHITWQDSMKPQFIPYIDEHGFQGMKVIIEHQKTN
tara:strand:- start:272 stop:487 length:216 start_codon:yes stop_codon:yes gene_type:complete